jgi:hypothetical protein
MKEPTFDIFTGTSDKNAIWLDTVNGLSNARARMYELAAQIPGQYFIFSGRTHSIVARIETFEKPDSAEVKIAKAKSA